MKTRERCDLPKRFWFYFLFILVSKCALNSVLAGDSHCDLLLSHLPLSAFTSLRPSGALAVCGARRTSWTWRCLGSVTRGETTIASASSYRRIKHFEADLELTFNCIIFGKHFFLPLLLQVVFLIFSCQRMRLGPPPRSSGGGSGWLPLLSSGHSDYRGMGPF